MNRCMTTGTAVLSNMNLHAYYMTIVAANLTAPNMSTFAQMSNRIGAFSRNFDNLYGQLSRFTTTLNLDASDNSNFKELVEKSVCDYMDLKTQSISFEECISFGNGILKSKPIEVIRWLKAEMPGLVIRLQGINTTSNKFEFIEQQTFLTFEFIN